MNIHRLREFVASFQEPDGRIASEPCVKATAEFLLVHRLCPHICTGNVESARSFLQEYLPVSASREVKKGVSSLESIWQIAVGIPEATVHLSEVFTDIACSSVTPSIKSALLLVLWLQKYSDPRLQTVLSEVISYQHALFSRPTLDSLYETTHNCLTFWAGISHSHASQCMNILKKSGEWLSSHVLSCAYCIDLLSEVLGIMLLIPVPSPVYHIAFSVLEKSQNSDGGVPLFAGGDSAFHASLVTLWAQTAYATYEMEMRSKNQEVK